MQESLRSIEKLQRKLDGIGDFIEKKGDDVLDKRTKKARAALKSEPYPPKRANQRYVRTGRLANSWSQRRIKRNNFAIANSSGYAHWVVDRQRQAEPHQDRWWVWDEVVDRELEPAAEDLGKLVIDWWVK